MRVCRPSEKGVLAILRRARLVRISRTGHLCFADGYDLDETTRVGTRQLSHGSKPWVWSWNLKPQRHRRHTLASALKERSRKGTCTQQGYWFGALSIQRELIFCAWLIDETQDMSLTLLQARTCCSLAESDGEEVHKCETHLTGTIRFSQRRQRASR